MRASRPAVRSLLALAACLPLASCQRAVAPTELVAGVYRAVLALPGGELPFGMTIQTPAGGKPVVYLLNGAEAVHVTEFGHDGARLLMQMPGYANRLELSADATGYRGEAVMVRRGGKEVRLPLRVVRGERYRFVTTAPKIPPQIGGRWAITVRDADGQESAAVGEFKQLGSRIFGTILDPTGDHRFLEGEVTSDELLLSRFDGGSAFLYRARINADGTLSGRWWSGSWSVAQISAHRDEAATLTDPAEAAVSDKPPQPLQFAFPDLDGRTVSLADERFRGKVVIVALGGTWCANCHDEASFLVPLYRDLKDQGLEIVLLQFEHFGDLPRAVAVNRRFIATFGIQWPVLIAGTSDRDEAARKVPALGHVYAFPTTVLVGRDGRVRTVHSGFSGLATGRHYEEFRNDFTAQLRALLAEKG